MTLNFALKYSVLGLIFLSLASPLVETSFLYYSYTTGRVIYFRSIVALAFGLYLILVLRDRSFLPGRSHILSALAVFVVVLAIANLSGVHPYRSFWGYLERMDGYANTLHLVAFMLMASSMLKTQRCWSLFWHSSLVVSVVVGYYAIAYQSRDLLSWSALTNGLTHTDSRIAGSLGHPIFLGVYALFHIFIAGMLLVQALKKNKYKPPWVLYFTYLFAAAWNALVLIKTGSRGPAVGLLAGALVFALVITLSSPHRIRILKYVAAVFVSVAIAIVWLGVSDNHGRVMARYAALIALPTELSEQISDRVLIWNTVLKGASERPLFGWGQENFNYVYNKFQAPQGDKYIVFHDRAHNVILEWLIAGGVFGLLSYLALFLALIWHLWKMPIAAISKSERNILSGMLAAYFTQNLFGLDTLTSYILYFSLLAYIHSTYQRTLLATGAPPEAMAGISVLRSKLLRYSATVLILISCWQVLLHFSYRPFQISFYLFQAAKLQRLAWAFTDENGMQSVYNYFARALDLGNYGTPEISEHIVNYSLRVLQYKAHPMPHKHYLFAQKAALESIAMFPDDARIIAYTARLFSVYGDHQGAIAYAEKVRSLAPGKSQYAVNLAIYHLRYEWSLGPDASHETSVRLFKQAYEMDPSFELAASYYAVGLLLQRDYQAFQELIDQRPDLVMDNRVAHALIYTKAYDLGLPILEKRFDVLKNSRSLMYLEEMLEIAAQYGVHLSEANLRKYRFHKDLFIRQGIYKPIDPISLDSFLLKD